jgi:hypothetical protein
MKKREIQLVVAVYPLLCLGGVARGTELMDATWQAICWVESRNDPNAYNAAEDAAGVAQIRPCYLRDANEHVGAPVFGLSAPRVAQSSGLGRTTVDREAHRRNPRSPTGGRCANSRPWRLSWEKIHRSPCNSYFVY